MGRKIMSNLKIISWNVNGIRTRIRSKDIVPILEKEPDIILFQETKASYEQMDKKFLNSNSFNYYFLKGESARTGGLASFTKDVPRVIKRFFNKSKDALHRACVLDYNDFILVHVYAPIGTGKKANFNEKIEYYNSLLSFVEKNKDQNIIIAGDFNIAHKDLDISNKDTKVTFTQEERSILDKLESFGFVDALRLFNEEESFSYWKNKEENDGARLDYFFVSESLKDKVKSSSVLVDVEGSKHLPIELEIEI